MQFESSTAKIKARLVRDGWVHSGGTKHDKFERDGRMIMVPRHRTVTPGAARSIAKTAGWSG